MERQKSRRDVTVGVAVISPHICCLLNIEDRDVAREGGSRGSRDSPLSLIERFSKDDTTPLTTQKRGKNDVEMP